MWFCFVMLCSLVSVVFLVSGCVNLFSGMLFWWWMVGGIMVLISLVWLLKLSVVSICVCFFGDGLMWWCVKVLYVFRVVRVGCLVVSVEEVGCGVFMVRA